MKHRILLADDHTLLREALKGLLEREPGLQVVAEAGNGREAVKKALETRPDIAVLDLGMPELNGVEAARQILAARPRTRIICLSMHDDTKFVDAMLEAGAMGYVLKNDASSELVAAIQRVLRGEVYLSPAVNNRVVRRYANRETVGGAESARVLSDRERQVLQLLAEGRTNKEIGGILEVTEKTVSTHREHIMDKLDLHDVASLTRYAIREGIIQP